MDTELVIDAERATIRMSGVARWLEFVAAQRDLLAHPRWRPGMALLIDCRRVDARDMPAAHVYALAEATRSHATALGGGRCAFLVASEFGYGLVRMHDLYASDGTSLTSSVFYEEAEAEAWLGGEAGDPGREHCGGG